MNENQIKRTCSSCGSDNISYQRETVASIGGSIHSFSKGHGCLYVILIGWWIWVFKLLWGLIKMICTGGLSLLFKKNKNIGKSINASKNINRTVAVCQNCGNTWKI